MRTQPVNTDPQVLLVLLAVRMQGGQAPAATEIFKGLKTGLKEAREQGLVAESTVPMSVTSKAGKTTVKKTAVLTLTEQGEMRLRQAASPEALAATGAGQLQALQKSLENDRLTLRDEVAKALAKKETKGDPGKEIAALAKSVATLLEKVQKIETAFQSQSDAGLLARIDQQFALFQQKLDKAIRAEPSSKEPAPRAETLPGQLQRAYRKLRQFVDFEDGLVPIPRLYHEVRREAPQLTVAAFHQELERLWSERVLELKVLNEVRSAAEPDKAIRRDDNLYYFIYWPGT